MSYIDIAIIVLIALFALIGLWKGFFKSVVALFGWFISMLIAVLLTKVVAYALLDIKAIGNFVCGSGGGFSLYQWILGFLPEDGVAGGVLSVIYKMFSGYADSPVLAGGTSAQSMALMISYGLFCVIVCIGLFIAIRILMMLFTMFIKSFQKEGKPGGVSRLLGFIVGGVRGFAYAAVILFILGYTLAFPQLAPVSAQMDNSVIAKPVYTAVQSMTSKLFMGKNDATVEKLVKIAGLDDAADGGEDIGGGSDDGQDTAGGGSDAGQDIPDNGGVQDSGGSADQDGGQDDGGGSSD